MSLVNNLRNYRTILQRFSHCKILETHNQKPKISTSALKPSSVKDSGTHRPSTLEKYLLVWMKKYPSVKDVPSTVSIDTMSKVRDWSRIKLNIIICFITAFACIAMVYSGKKAASRGETIRKINQQWHEDENAKTK